VAYDEVRAAEVLAKEADIRAKKALEAAEAADRAALRAERKWQPHSNVPREASVNEDDGGDEEPHNHTENEEEESDSLGALAVKKLKLPPLPNAKAGSAKATTKSSAKAKGTGSLFSSSSSSSLSSSSSSANPATDGAAVHLEGVELAEHLRAVADTAQHDASQLELGAQKAHHDVVLAEAHAAARVASAREYLGHHEPADWRVGPLKKGGKHNGMKSGGGTGEHHSAEDDDAIARAVAKAEASVGGSMLDAGDLDPEASFAAQVAGERGDGQEDKGGKGIRGNAQQHKDKDSHNHRNGAEEEGLDHEARAESNHAEDCSQAQRGWLAWASDPHTWLCLARASRRAHLWPGAVDHAQAALDRLPPLPPPEHQGRDLPPTLPSGEGSTPTKENDQGFMKHRAAVATATANTSTHGEESEENTREPGSLRPFHSVPVAPEAKSRAEALFIQV